MKKGIMVVALATFLMTISVSATELEISPETIEIDLVGGNCVQVNITVNWTGSHSASCELATYIEPDGEGINITYSKNNFTMTSNSENKIIMYINTSMLLMPGTYIITTNISVETEEQESSGEKDDSSKSWGKAVQPTDPVIPEDEEPEDEEPEDEKDEFNDTIYYKADVEDTPICPFLIGLGVIIFAIIFLYLISKKRKEAEKPGENQK